MHHKRTILEERSYKVIPDSCPGRWHVMVKGVHPHEISWKISDLKGQVVAFSKEHIAGDNSFPIEAGDIDKGQYILSINEEDGFTRHLKLVV